MSTNNSNGLNKEAKIYVAEDSTLPDTVTLVARSFERTKAPLPKGVLSHHCIAQGWLIEEVIEAILSPYEEVTLNGLLMPRKIHRKLADKLRTNIVFASFGHIEERTTKESGEKEYLLWRLKEWQESHRNATLKRKEDEVRTVQYLKYRDRIKRTLESIFKAYPRYKREHKLAIQMLSIWIEDYKENQVYKDELEFHRFFDGLEDDEIEVRQLIADVETLREKMKNVMF